MVLEGQFTVLFQYCCVVVSCMLTQLIELIAQIMDLRDLNVDMDTFSKNK